MCVNSLVGGGGGGGTTRLSVFVRGRGDVCSVFVVDVVFLLLLLVLHLQYYCFLGDVNPVTLLFSLLMCVCVTN